MGAAEVEKVKAAVGVVKRSGVLILKSVTWCQN